MSVTFYINERQDGGRRTGLYVGELRALERFVAGGRDYDAALLWFLDAVWDAPTPADRDAARRWHRAMLPELKVLLADAAEQLRAGVDIDSGPAKLTFPTSAGLARVNVSCVRRLGWAGVADGIRRAVADDIDHVQPYQDGVAEWRGASSAATG